MKKGANRAACCFGVVEQCSPFSVSYSTSIKEGSVWVCRFFKLSD